MARFWEGNRGEVLTAPLELQVPAAPVAAVRKPTAPKLMPQVDRALMSDAAIAEYREVATEIGLGAQDILVEEFRAFLAKHDLPIFSLAEVTSYMDEIAARDNPTGYGWHWCPVRPKDAGIPMTFGRPCQDHRQFSQTPSIIAASDYYESHRFAEWQRGRGGWSGGGGWGTSSSPNHTTVHVHSASSQMQAEVDRVMSQPPSAVHWRDMPSPAYTRTLPLHALKKIALIERNFKSGQIAFLVTDYATAPHIIVNPDPFLMAVIPNSAVAHGKGRFIIDVWDEPGFGIERQIR